MTAEPDLLPLPAPDYLLPLGPGHGAISMWSENTIRQIVAHATAAKDAEIEALRAEVESAKRMTETVHESLRIAVANELAAEARAERLAEALRDAADDIDAGVSPADVAAHLRARADLLRDQEEGHEQ